MHNRQQLKHNIFQNIAVSTSTIVITLICAEIGLRVLFPSPVIPLDDPILGVRAHPGGEYDARGYRNLEALEETDIVTMGDSQTFGYGVSRAQSWPEQLQAITGSSTYQMAHNSWGPPTYRALMPEALALHPKAMVVALYAGNDMLDTVDSVYRLPYWKSYRNPEFKYSPDLTNEVIAVGIALNDGYEVGTFWNRFVRARQIAQHASRLYELLDVVVSNTWWRFSASESPVERTARFDALLQDNPELGIRLSGPRTTILSPSYRYRMMDLTDPIIIEGWRITTTLLEEMHKQSTEIGVPFYIVFIPTKEMVYLENAKLNNKTIGGLEKHDAAERTLASSTAAFCAERSIHCIFPLEALAARLTNAALYQTTNDGHPLAEGYRIIAAGVAREIAGSTK